MRLGQKTRKQQLIKEDALRKPVGPDGRSRVRPQQWIQKGAVAAGDADADDARQSATQAADAADDTDQQQLADVACTGIGWGALPCSEGSFALHASAGLQLHPKLAKYGD